MVYKSGQIFLPFCHNSRVWRTDRQTDRILIARPRLHSMQRGKNGSESYIMLKRNDGSIGKQALQWAAEVNGD